MPRSPAVLEKTGTDLGYRPVGTTARRALGSDDNAPYRVFQDVSGLPKGTPLEYRAVLKDASGNYSVSGSYGVVGDAPAPGGGGGGTGPVVQPANVSVPGDHNSEMGCPADWAPDCDQAQLTLDPQDKVWKGTYPIPAGEHAYKAAINKTWDENYGAGGNQNGANISYTATSAPTTFYYEHGRHYVTSSAEGPIITVPGTFQKALGCANDWDLGLHATLADDQDGPHVHVVDARSERAARPRSRTTCPGTRATRPTTFRSPCLRGRAGRHFLLRPCDPRADGHDVHTGRPA